MVLCSSVLNVYIYDNIVLCLISKIFHISLQFKNFEIFKIKVKEISDYFYNFQKFLKEILLDQEICFRFN